MTAMVTDVIDEIAAMPVPEIWATLPDDMREDIGWWYVVMAVQEQQKDMQAIPLGPPMDVTWTITDDPAVLEAVELAHDCKPCQNMRAHAVTWLRDGTFGTVGLMQFRQKYFRNVRDMTKPYDEELIVRIGQDPAG